jgi:gamma-glutamyltranspeptidase
LAPHGELLKEGDFISRPEYAETLKEIAEHGSSVFYRGWIAEGLVETINKYGGNITLKGSR